MRHILNDKTEELSTKEQLKEALLNTKEENEQKNLFLECLKNMAQKDNGECERDFEVILTDYIENYHINANDILLFKELSASTNLQEQIVGIYLLYKHYRNTMNYNQLNSLLDEYSHLFADKISLGHLKTLYHIVTPGDYTEKELLSHLTASYETFEGYRKLSSELKNVNTAGAAHAYADLFATYCERYEDNETIRSAIFKNGFETASAAVIDAIKKDSSYAKYYCTYGRILALNHEYADAIKNIQKAIGLESSAPKTAERTLKIMEYKGYLITVQTKAKLHPLKSQQHELQQQQIELAEKANDASKHNLEIISFFSGIISFTIGSFSLAKGFEPRVAAGLIIILSGSLLIAFGGFSLLLHDTYKKVSKYIMLFILATLSILGGLYLVW